MGEKMAVGSGNLFEDPRKEKGAGVNGTDLSANRLMWRGN